MCEPERNTGVAAAAGATAGAVLVVGAASAVAVVLAAWWPWLLAAAVGTAAGTAGVVWWLHRFVTVIAMPARPAVVARLALPARVPLAIEAPAASSTALYPRLSASTASTNTVPAVRQAGRRSNGGPIVSGGECGPGRGDTGVGSTATSGQPRPFVPASGSGRRGGHT